MNNTKSVFQNEISIADLGKFFKLAAEDAINVLNYPSCISFGLIKK